MYRGPSFGGGGLAVCPEQKSHEQWFAIGVGENIGTDLLEAQPLSAHHALPVQAALSMTPILGTEQQQGSWIVSLCWRHPALGLKVTCCCQRAVCIIIVVVIIIIVISSSIKSLYLGGLPILWVASENPAASYVVRCLLIFILCCAIMFPSFSILMDSHRSLKSLRVCLWTGALCEPLRVMLAGTRTLSTRDHVPLRVAFVR